VSGERFAGITALDLRTETFLGAPPFATGLLFLDREDALMSVRHIVDRTHANAIRQVLMDVQAAMQELDTDSCDAADVQEVIDKATAELDAAQPNVATLGTYLNSLARSLRHEPRVRTLVMELDAAMREAHVPANWEH
jgi:hypothetical protein